EIVMCDRLIGTSDFLIRRSDGLFGRKYSWLIEDYSIFTISTLTFFQIQNELGVL
ncbi:hypothetical protein ACJX0J_029489, partial [Zea mays]